MWWWIGGIVLALYLSLGGFFWCACVLAARSDRIHDRRLRVIQGGKR